MDKPTDNVFCSATENVLNFFGEVLLLDKKNVELLNSVKSAFLLYHIPIKKRQGLLLALICSVVRKTAFLLLLFSMLKAHRT